MWLQVCDQLVKSVLDLRVRRLPPSVRERISGPVTLCTYSLKRRALWSLAGIAGAPSYLRLKTERATDKVRIQCGMPDPKIEDVRVKLHVGPNAGIKPRREAASA